MPLLMAVVLRSILIKFLDAGKDIEKYCKSILLYFFHKSEPNFH